MPNLTWFFAALGFSFSWFGVCNSGAAHHMAGAAHHVAFVAHHIDGAAHILGLGLGQGWLHLVSCGLVYKF